ncbi:MAG: hypothetical protein AB7O37_20680 [Vicinamibacteria bacterium]
MSDSHRGSAGEVVRQARHCAYCGSSRVRPSRKGALFRFAMRLLGASVTRCDACGRRFAFTPLSRRNGRGHQGD